MTVAETGLESAKQQASLLRAGARPEEVYAAELSVTQAQNVLAAASDKRWRSSFVWPLVIVCLHIF